MLLFIDFPTLLPVFEPRSVHVRFVVDEVVLNKIFSEYFGFPTAVQTLARRYTDYAIWAHTSR
jgi:hypothetical protein